MRSLLVVALTVALVGCGDRGGVDFVGDDLGADLHVIHGDDGAVKMGLTREWVYFALSDSVIAEARADLNADAEAEGGRGFFGRFMQNVVGKALNFRAKFAVAEIRDIRWQDGEMYIEFVDPDRRVGENMRFNEDEPVTEAFAEEDVRAIGEAFRALKAAGAGGEGADAQH